MECLFEIIQHNIENCLDLIDYIWSFFSWEMVPGIAALAAVIAAWRSASATRRATEATLFSDLSREYSSPKMNEALSMLAELKSNKGESYIEEYDRQNESTDGLRLDDARRKVSHFFCKITEMFELGYIKEKTFVKFLKLWDFGVYIHVVEGLEKHINENYNKKPFETVKKYAKEHNITIELRAKTKGPKHEDI